MKLKLLAAVLVVALAMQLTATVSFATPVESQILLKAYEGDNTATLEITGGLVPGILNIEIYRNGSTVADLEWGGKKVISSIGYMPLVTIPLKTPAIIGDQFMVRLSGVPVGLGGGPIEKTTQSIASTPRIVVSGSSYISSDISVETFTISVRGMPRNTSSIVLTLRVEDKYIREDSFQIMDKWLISADSGWFGNWNGGNPNYPFGFWYRELELVYPGGMPTTGESEVFVIWLGLKAFDAGTTDVEIVAGATGSTPAGEFELEEVSLTLTFDPWNKFDVNRDFRVSQADVAAVAFFYMWNDANAAWDNFNAWDDPRGFRFENLVTGADAFVKPFECDVNRDGVVDIEDAIYIRINYSWW